jgi:cell division protein FtsN
MFFYGDIDSIRIRLNRKTEVKIYMDREAVTGHELVLDNRKLILTFAVLIVLLGFCYGIGYREGKHQGYEEGSQVAAESAINTNAGSLTATTSTSSDDSATATPLKEEISDPQLNWYKNVNRSNEEPEAITPSSGPPEVAPKEEPASETAESKRALKKSPQQTIKKIAKEAAEKVIPQAKAASSDRVAYVVQVGAFRARREVEIKAKALRAAGYDCRIEVPNSPEELYLLKVGKFSSRADATATQLKLKKSGFTSFIKIN